MEKSINKTNVVGKVCTNCFFWVAWKFITKGGRIRWRKAKTGYYPHFYWITPCGTKQYDVVPRAGHPTFPYIIFDGIIRLRYLTKDHE